MYLHRSPQSCHNRPGTTHMVQCPLQHTQELEGSKLLDQVWVLQELDHSNSPNHANPGLYILVRGSCRLVGSNEEIPDEEFVKNWIT